MKTKFKIYFALLLIIMVSLTQTVFTQTKWTIENKEWTGSPEQKVFGLMTVWSEAKYNFPWFDKLPDLDWDAKVTEYIPKVIAAMDIDSYYKVLMEFATLLKDGHTGIWPPWFPFKQSDDMPALEVQIVENKFIVARVGDTEDNKSQKIYPGLEIVEVEANIPVQTYFRENVLRYNTTGSELGDQILVWSIFLGPRNSKLSVKVKDVDGTIRDVMLTRNSLASGALFLPRFAMWNGFEKNIEIRNFPNNIQYIRIPNFTTPGMLKEFQDMVDILPLDKTKGMIIDLRYNSGGNDRTAKQMISCLIDRPISTPLLKIPQYIGAYRAWERGTQMLETSDLIFPRSKKKYLGPIVILIGIGTASTAEDFSIEMEFSGRALLVGEKTPGSAGNPIHVPLPGGGTLRVATFRSYYPDGSEYMHGGIVPNVSVSASQKDLRDSTESILVKGIEVINNWELYSTSDKKFKISASSKIKEILTNSNFRDAKPKIDALIVNNEMYYLLETEFNLLGYDLLKENRNDDAVELFKMTTELYPISWNAYDSYAEALMKKGDTQSAIENFKKSLKLNPNNKNAQDILKSLIKSN